MKNIVVLVSGGGTNLQALIDAEKKGMFQNGKITCVIASNDKAYALERAKNNGIDTKVVARKSYATASQFDDAMIDALVECKADIIVLAGFLSILGKKVTDKFENKIINVHPSLIPSFCGEGYYGLKVHEEALKYGVKVTGATVHFVNEVADGGKIILQKAVEIMPGDTPEILQKRVMEQAEWELLPKAVAMLCEE